MQDRLALPVHVPGLSTNDDAIDRWQARSGRSDTVLETFELCQQGLTPAEIAQARDLKENTIYAHLARLIGDGKIELQQVIPPEMAAQIGKAIAEVGDTSRLWPIKAKLPDEITYEQIRCVLAAYDSPETDKTEPKPVEQMPDSPPLSPDTVILETAAKLGGTLGRTGLSQFLTGSKAGWLETYAGHSFYGQLANLSQKAVLNIIDALIANGKLATTGGNRPKVILPDQPLTPQPAAVDQVDSDQTTDTPSPISNSELFEVLRAWRTDQAKVEGVPPYVVFSNKVMEAIAAKQPATLRELAEISGIGPAKLDKYGDAVLHLVAENSAEVGTASQTVTVVESEAETAPQTAPRSSLDSPPLNAILTVVSELDGLLTAHGLALLLTAAPDDIVSFSDHNLFGTFHGKMTVEEMEEHAQQAIQAGRLSLSAHQRILLNDDQSL